MSEKENKENQVKETAGTKKEEKVIKEVKEKTIKEPKAVEAKKESKTEVKQVEKKEDKNEAPKPSGADKQRIDNILDAVNNAEKKLQDKINEKKVKPRATTNEKDW